MKFDCWMEEGAYKDWALRYTHNGYQTASVNINNITEAKKIVTVLERWIRQQTPKKSKPAVQTKLRSIK